MAKTIKKLDNVLKNFMEDFFDFNELKKSGFYSKDIKKTDYKKQADRVCLFFGYKTVYEFGSKEVSAHISYVEGKRPLIINEKGELKEEPFITIFPSIYE